MYDILLEHNKDDPMAAEARSRITILKKLEEDDSKYNPLSIESRRQSRMPVNPVDLLAAERDYRRRSINYGIIPRFGSNRTLKKVEKKRITEPPLKFITDAIDEESKG